MSKSADDDLDALFAAAKAARARAYAPYSRFLGRRGDPRAERARSIPAATSRTPPIRKVRCAEAGAIAAMALAGERRIAKSSSSATARTCARRAAAAASASANSPTPRRAIHVAGLDGVRASFTLEELLPHSFGPGHLGR